MAEYRKRLPELEQLYPDHAPPWRQSPSQTLASHANAPAINAALPTNPLDRARNWVTDSDYFRRLAPEAQKVLTGSADIAEFAPPVAAARGGYELGAGAAGSDYGRAALGLLDTVPELGKAAGAVVGAAGVPAIRAYHGSPHSFDKFDLSKIGTGEGAQVYGHGLYFAENEATARSYRDNLTAARTQFNHPVYGSGLNLDNADHAFMAAVRKASPGLDDSKVAEIATNLTEGLRGGDDLAHMARFVRDSDWPSDVKKGWQAGLDTAGQFTTHKPKGHMYEVDIHADPVHFLDWDKPLRENREPLNAMLNKYGGEDAVRRIAKEREEAADFVLKNWDKPEVRSQYEALAADPRARMGTLLYQMDQPKAWTGYDPGSRVRGEELYHALGGGEKATAALQESGVPGIKYLDQGSRNAGEGSRNYVTFRDDIIELRRKYGIPMMVGGAGYGAYQMAPEEEEQQRRRGAA